MAVDNIPAETRVIDTKEPFIAWLESLPAEAKFGRSTRECPLAQFSGCQVGWRSYDHGHLPVWAVRFVDVFLNGKGAKTARRALKVMERLS
jgi:hypothetical protein